MNLKYKDTIYILKFSFRALLLFESITGKRFAIVTVLDEFIYYYCLLCASNKIEFSFDDFVAELDNDSTILETFKEFVLIEASKQNEYKPDEVQDDKKKL